VRRDSAGSLRQTTLDTDATLGLVEALGRHVLLQDPKIETCARPLPGDDLRRFPHEATADPPSLLLVVHVQIVHQRAKHRVGIENRMDEADKQSGAFGDDGQLTRLRICQPLRPDGRAFSDDVAIQECVGIRPSIVRTASSSVVSGSSHPPTQ
jgi:hypothetical protein